LHSVCEDHQNYWQHYAFIDEINESTWFEFGLDTKVETQQSRENESQQNSKFQKTKRKPIFQAIQELDEQSLLIFGSSGSGKSTLLSKLFYLSALKTQKGESDLIPVLIELKSYETAGEDGGLEGLILNSLQGHDPDLGKEDLKRIRKEKRLSLFIDGFNELPSERAKPKIRQYCKNILTIATSRNEGDWRELGQRLEISPLTYGEVIDFFRERLPGTSREKLKELGSRVKDFGDTPLMVWMLYCVFNTNKEIPETLGEAYRRFTTLYLERLKEGIDLQESRVLLGKLAFEMMQSSSIGNPTNFRLEISETDAQNTLDSEQTLRVLRDCHLLKSDGKPGNRRIKFCHQSLQEYYAAEELLRKIQARNSSDTNPQQFKYLYLNYLNWTESLVMLISMLDDISLLRWIVKQSLEVDLTLACNLIEASSKKHLESLIELIESEIASITTRCWIFGRAKLKSKASNLMNLAIESDQEVRNSATAALLELCSGGDMSEDVYSFLQNNGFFGEPISVKTSISRRQTVGNILEAERLYEESLKPREKLFFMSIGPRLADIIAGVWELCEPASRIVFLNILLSRHYSTEHFKELRLFIKDRLLNQGEEMSDKLILEFISDKDRSYKNFTAMIVRLAELDSLGYLSFAHTISLLIISLSYKTTEILESKNRVYLRELTSIEFLKRSIKELSGNAVLLRDIIEVIHSIQSQTGLYNYSIFFSSSPETTPSRENENIYSIRALAEAKFAE
jgi:energy-coupling factor transporter ATP-binding protein EcfA2